MKYQYGFTGTCSVAQNPWVHGVGTGFVGTGAGWTSPTRAVPVCHPTHVPLRGCPLYLFLLYVLFCPCTFRFSSQTCHFRVPCSETCHLYLYVTGASPRGSFQQPCTHHAIQFPSPFRTISHPQSPTFFSLSSSSTISKFPHYPKVSLNPCTSLVFS